MPSIRERRESVGMTQRQLAKATGIAQPNIAAYESGRRPLTDGVRLRIEQATARRPSERVALHRERLHELVAQAGGANPRIFGSVARGDDELDSDVDLVIEFQRGTTLLAVAALQRELTALLGCEVDIISASTLTGRFADRVGTDLVDA